MLDLVILSDDGSSTNLHDVRDLEEIPANTKIISATISSVNDFSIINERKQDIEVLNLDMGKAFDADVCDYPSLKELKVRLGIRRLYLDNLPMLHTLYLSGHIGSIECGNIPMLKLHASNLDVDNLAICNHVVVLSIRSASMSFIKKMVNLKKISFEFSTVYLDILKGLSLTSIMFTNCYITGCLTSDTLEELSINGTDMINIFKETFPRLTDLTLSDPINKGNVSLLSNMGSHNIMRTVKKLSIDCYKSVFVNLKDTLVTDLYVKGYLPEAKMDIVLTESIESLEIVGCKMTSNKFMINLPNIKKLVIIGTSFKATINSLIGKLTTLKELVYRIKSLCSLTYLKGLVNLESLDLSGKQGYTRNICAPFYNLESLEGMTKLRVLNVSKTNLKNIDHIAHLTQLEELDISFTKVKDLSCLRGLNLRVFRGRNLQGYVNIFENMSNLEIIDLASSQIHDTSFVEGKDKLREAYLSDTHVISLKSFAKCPSLEVLDIRRCSVYDLSPLEELKNLKFADIRKSMVVHRGNIKATLKYNTFSITRRYLSDQLTVNDYFMGYQFDQVADTIIRDYQPCSDYSSMPEKLIEVAIKSRKEPILFRSVAERIWSSIISHPDKDLIISLIEEDLDTPCRDGQYYKFLAIICLFFEQYSVKLSPRAIVANIIARVVEENPGASDAEKVIMIDERVLAIYS